MLAKLRRAHRRRPGAGRQADRRADHRHLLRRARIGDRLDQPHRGNLRLGQRFVGTQDGCGGDARGGKLGFNCKMLIEMGEEAGWKFMDGLHENIGAYLHSGSAPCVQAARGERTIGLALDMRAASEKSKGAPIEVVIPKEGVGWEMEASAIVKGNKNMALTKKIADWSTTKAANELYSKTYAIVAAPGVGTKPASYPVNAEAGMINNDLGWMADNRERVLAEWSKRYESKAAPKN